MKIHFEKTLKGTEDLGCFVNERLSKSKDYDGKRDVICCRYDLAAIQDDVINSLEYYFANRKFDVERLESTPGRLDKVLVVKDTPEFSIFLKVYNKYHKFSGLHVSLRSKYDRMIANGNVERIGKREQKVFLGFTKMVEIYKEIPTINVEGVVSSDNDFRKSVVKWILLDSEYRIPKVMTTAQEEHERQRLRKKLTA